MADNALTHKPATTLAPRFEIFFIPHPSSLILSLAVSALELFHERDERFDALAREGVIDRSAAPAY